MSYTTIKREPKQKQPRFSQTFLLGVAKATGGTIIGLTLLTSSVLAGGMVGLTLSFRNLPDVRVLKNYLPSQSTYIYDIKGRLLTNLRVKVR